MSERLFFTQRSVIRVREKPLLCHIQQKFDEKIVQNGIVKSPLFHLFIEDVML